MRRELHLEKMRNQFAEKGRDAAAEQTHIELLTLAQKTVDSLQKLLSEKENELADSQALTAKMRKQLD